MSCVGPTPAPPSTLATSSLQVLINQGARGFADETVERVGAPPQGGMPRNWVNEFYAEDFNSDGCPDLLFPDDTFGTQDAGIWFNDCQGNFTPLAAPGLPKRAGTYIPLDFDGDGDIDLISAISRHTFIGGSAGCSPGEGDASDHMDFAVLTEKGDGAN